MAAKIQRVRALRNFWHKNEQVGVGSVFDVDTPLAMELSGARKVELVQADTQAKMVPPSPKPPRKPDAQSLLERVVEGQAKQSEQLGAVIGQLGAVTEQLAGLAQAFAGFAAAAAEKKGK